MANKPRKLKPFATHRFGFQRVDLSRAAPPTDTARTNLRQAQTHRNRRVKPSMPKMPWEKEEHS